MTCSFTCTADPRDVLAFKTSSGKDLFSELLPALENALSIKIEAGERKFNSITFSVIGGAAPDERAVNEAAKKICEELKIKTVHITPSAQKENKAPPAPEGGAQTKNAPDKGTSETAPETQKGRSGDPYNEILSMVGIEEIKRWAEKIHTLPSPEGGKSGSKAQAEALTGVSYLMAIDPGNGCSTIVGHMGRMIADKLGRKRFEVREITLHREEDRDDLFDVLAAVPSVPSNDSLFLYAFHVDQFIGHFHTERFVRFLRALRKSRDCVVFVFVLPLLEDGTLQRIRSDFDDALSCRLLRVRPYTDTDLLCLFERHFSECGMKVDPACHELLLRKVAAEKSDGRFYGVDTVHKICGEILFEKITSGTADDTVTPRDVTAVLPVDERDGTAGEKQLDRLVGLADVKKKVREICATIRWEKQTHGASHRSMHMMFSGAPGTGKTAVARVIGKILKEEGVLARGEFFEVSRKDLVGRYVGQTAPKTAEVCRMAYDSVLFIDEAYALAGGGDNDFGKEAISTLIAEMENHRDRMIVIFAGYEKELEKLFDLNPGLRDRVPYHLKFPNYTREELKDIFFVMLPSDTVYDDDFRTHVEDYFRNLSDEVLQDENFSNARFVRNIVERTISKAALRLTGSEPSEKTELLASDFDLAAEDAEFKGLGKKKRAAIGF